MNKFDTLIQEALSFNKTFKAPDSNEKAQRRSEVFEDALSKVEKTKLEDGTWHVHGEINLINAMGVNLKSLDGLNVSIVDGDY